MPNDYKYPVCCGITNILEVMCTVCMYCPSVFTAVPRKARIAKKVRAHVSVSC